jgi:hypothetical protein
VSLNYTQLVQTLSTMTQFNPGDPTFTQTLSSAIDYATNRINRELNLLSTVARNSTLALTPGNRFLNVNSITGLLFNVITDVNVITPAGSSPDVGVRNPVTFVDKSWLDMVYPKTVTAGLPVNWTWYDNYLTGNMLFGPFPDQAYTVELMGTQYPQTISPTQQTTWVCTYMPELFIAACMIFFAGVQKNFSSTSDDPNSAMSWEQQYTKLRDSAQVEDMRRKFKSVGWTPELPTPVNPQRV